MKKQLPNGNFPAYDTPMTKQTPESWETSFDERFNPFDVDIVIDGKTYSAYPCIKSFIKENFLPKADLLAEIERRKKSPLNELRESVAIVHNQVLDDLASWIKEQ